MKNRIRRILPGMITSVVSLTVIFSFASLSAQVNAQEATSGGGSTARTEVKTETTPSNTSETPHSVTGTTNTTETHKSSEETATNARHQAEEQANEARREITTAKLSNEKLKVCTLHKSNIDSHVNQIADRVTKQMTLFTTIATRAETFYTAKGHTLASYDSLVANVTAKKAAAQSAIDAAVSKKSTFSCDAAAPKAAIESYKTSITSVSAALKEYRTAIKTLIVGIKSVNQTTNSDSARTTGGTQ